ncbi:heavy metal translocating P-type ATPase [Candidatus Albibeggiatoa sp. nov. NOAA]|uniref:heavy metal translocating P-type ATPase n=1 Tax=Candidatus Albibeggiatoa sp. nov. NOAA TaxID=3162724 RepID=UPI0032F09F94|nr:heavy metal translocating P-type ATPase [Thiotrichaceae bacterium]
MILNVLVLGSVLYIGFQKLTNQTKSPTQKGTSDGIHQPEKNIVEEKFNQIFKNSHKQALKEKNKREIISAAMAFGVSSVGVLWYPPLVLLSVPLVIYASKSYYQMAYELAKHHQARSETLLAITITGCFAFGYFVTASVVALSFNIANRLAMEVTQHSRQTLIDAFERHPEFVWIVIDDTEVSIPFDNLKQGDTVVVHTGEMIPVDGKIIKGMANIDQHILTGEAKPVEKEQDAEVFASTLVLSGTIYVKVEKIGENSTVAKITKILNTTVDYKSTVQLRAETLSQQLVSPALIAGGLALPLIGLNGALAVINAHPKNKMMVVSPIAIMNYINLASQQGILIKDGRSLELLSNVDTVVFDKTGTLTEAQPHVGTIYSAPDYTENDILIYAAAAEYKQNHPLAKAILQEAKHRQLDMPAIDDSEYKMGYGMTVTVAGKTIHVGSARFMEIEHISMSATFQEQHIHSLEAGYSLVMVALDKQVIGAIELLPTIRPEAKQVVSALKQRNNIKKTVILSGDHHIPTQKLAEMLGIDVCFAETLPEDKANMIEDLQQKGHFICYIGDGINDSVAMKKSQVSISLGGASTIAIDTAQIVLMDGGLKHLDSLFDLSDHFNANMNTSFAIILIPGVICLSGAFLMGFGVAQTVVLNSSAIVLSIGNAMIPLLKNRKPS